MPGETQFKLLFPLKGLLLVTNHGFSSTLEVLFKYTKFSTFICTSRANNECYLLYGRWVVCDQPFRWRCIHTSPKCTSVASSDCLQFSAQ